MGLIIFLIRSKFETTHEENGLKINSEDRLPIRITFKKIHSRKIRLSILQSKWNFLQISNLKMQFLAKKYAKYFDSKDDIKNTLGPLK